MALVLRLPMFVVAGSWLAPRLSRHMRERWLKGLLTLVLPGIALRYLEIV